MLSAKQGSHRYHFYNVFGMTRPGIDPTPILTWEYQLNQISASSVDQLLFNP